MTIGLFQFGNQVRIVEKCGVEERSFCDYMLSIS